MRVLLFLIVCLAAQAPAFAEGSGVAGPAEEAASAPPAAAALSPSAASVALSPAAEPLAISPAAQALSPVAEPLALSPSAAVLSATAQPAALSGTAADSVPAPASAGGSGLAAPVVAAEAAESPMPGAVAKPFKALLTLKDGQSAEVTVEGHDSVFLEARSSAGKLINVPWSLVASLKPLENGPELAAMNELIHGNEPSDLKMALQAKDPSKAFQKALWPGFFIHGAGHREAGKQEAFVSLLGAELFGVVVGAFGGVEMLENGNQADTSQQLVIGGLALYAVTWAWDLILAPGAARSFNAEHGLALEPTRDGLKLALRF